MSVDSPPPSPNATSGENAGATAFGNATSSTGGAFSLGSTAWNGPTVFYGYKPGPGAGGEYETQGRRAVGKPLMITPQEAYQDYYNWTPAQRAQLTQWGILSGQIKDGAGDLETSAWWKSLVEQSARYGAAGVQMSPLQLASGYADAAGQGLTDQQRFNLKPGSFPAGAIFDSSGKYTRSYREGQFKVNEITGERTYIGPKFKTVTNTRTDLTDPATAKALTTSVFQQLIGRDPGPGELGKFAAALQAAEQANPVTENTTQQFDDQGNVIASNTTATGGLTQAAQQQLMQDQLKQTKEYAVQQAATTYMAATKKAIWGGPSA